MGRFRRDIEECIDTLWAYTQRDEHRQPELFTKRSQRGGSQRDFELELMQICNTAPEQRWPLVAEWLDTHARDRQNIWLSSECHDQILPTLTKGVSFTFCYAPSLRLCLSYAQRERARGDHSYPIIYLSETYNNYETINNLCKILGFGREEVIIHECEPLRWLEHHDISAGHLVMVPPLGAKVHVGDLSERINARLGISKFKTNKRFTLDTVTLASLLEFEPETAVLFTSERSLMRMVGVEPGIRGELAQSGHLRAVANTPSALRRTSTDANLMFWASDERREYVRFIDLVNALQQQHAEPTAEPTKSAESTKLTELITRGVTDADHYIQDVELETLCDADYVLSPHRYVGYDDSLSHIHDLHRAQGGSTEMLSDLVEFIRPQFATPGSGSGHYFREVTTAHMTRSGYITQPEDRAEMTAKDHHWKLKHSKLKPHDILIAVRGSVGVMGLVPDPLPQPEEEETWVTSPLFIILRMRPHKRLSPIALFEYLSSALVIEQLKYLSTNTRVATLSVHDLKSLPVLIPDEETASRIESRFRERLALQNLMRELEAQISAHKDVSWPQSLAGE